MITLKEWMEVVNYRITEGSNFMWDCYGPDSYSLDSWNGDQDGHSFSITFDTKTQVVYEVQSHDYRNQRAYRLVNPDFASERDVESTDRSVSLSEAWDGVDYIEDYDTRVTVPLDLDDHEMFTLMKMAHERDLTLNEFVEEILREQLNRMGVKL